MKLSIPELDIIPKSQRSEKDFRIIYEAGKSVRFFGLCASFVALLFVLFEITNGMINWNGNYSQHKLANYLCNLHFVGRGALIIVLVYLLKFYRHVGFQSYDPFRFNFDPMKKNKNERRKYFLTAILFVIGFSVLLFFFGYAYIYFLTLEHSAAIYNSTAFLMLLCFINPIALSGMAQIVMIMVVQLFYIRLNTQRGDIK